MKNFIILFLYLIFSISIIRSALSQNQSKNDSLGNLLTTSKDTTRIRILNELANNYRRVDTTKVVKYANEALNLAIELGDMKGKGDALHCLASRYSDDGNYNKALEYYNNSITVKEKTGNKRGVASSLLGIGNIYDILGNYNQALHYYYRALKINEELGDKRGTAFSHLGIGNILNTLGRNEKSLDHYQQSIKLLEELDDKYLSWALNNIASVYTNMSDFDKALEYYNKSLKLKEKEGDKYGITFTLKNIGTIYRLQGDYERAFEILQRSLKLKLELETEIETIATSMIEIGEVLTDLGKYDESLKYLDDALKIAKETNAKLYIKSCYKGYSRMFAMQKKFDKAYEFFQLYSDINDSLYNEESSKQIAEMQTKYETEKKEKEIKLLNTEKTLQASELNKQKIIIFSGAGGLLLVMALAFFMYRGYRHKQIANVLLAAQKQVIETKNKDITDSIRYAQNIQQATLPLIEDIKRVLPESFVLFKPKDIVSGDFYFFSVIAREEALKTSLRGTQRSEVTKQSDSVQEIASPSARNDGGEAARNDVVVIAACDSTGHGVPGAFMSMLGSRLLNEIVNDKSVTDAAMVLNQLRDGIIHAFGKAGARGEQKDGMDMALCVFDLKTNMLQYAGANNPLYIVRRLVSGAEPNGNNNKTVIQNEAKRSDKYELIQVRADKQPVGYTAGEQTPFTNHDIQLNKGDAIYMSSDGYKDQFGGAAGKKFMDKKFRQLLLDIHEMNMEEQKEHLNKTIEDWKGSEEQVDDILLIGVRV